MIQIGLIGAGEIGSRHLQAMANLNQKAVVQIVDPSMHSLRKAQKQFQEVNKTGDVQVEYSTNILDLHSKLDVVIVATNSDVRKSVIETIVKERDVQYFILEKVLFQKVEDYYIIGKLLAEKNIKAWVNCARRANPFYKFLKDKLVDDSNLNIIVSGSNWGIGCNSIHFLDLAAYLTNCYQVTLNYNSLDINVFPSKRKGFFEFSGVLVANFNDYSKLVLASFPNGNSPLIINIDSNTINCIVRESEGRAWITERIIDKKWIEMEFEIIYQSNLSHRYIHDLIETGTCDLITLEKSCQLHIPFIKCLLEHLKEVDGERVSDLCSIT